MISPKTCAAVASLILFAAGIFAAQPQGPGAVNGLLRLKNETHPGEAPPLASDKFEVDELTTSSGQGTTKINRNQVEVLVLETGTEWSRPLRGMSGDVTFVSLQLYASQSSVIEIAGARLGLTTHASDGYLQLMYDDSASGALQWKGLGLIMRHEPHGGRMLAELPVLTIRIDPGQGVWDLYLDARLLAHGLPLIAAKKAERKITIRAGTHGAWLAGLVLADENPLYEDSNQNGIDDRFEQRQRGVLLAKNASVAERRFLAEQWKAAQRETGAPILVFKRPLPDRALVTVPGNQ